LLQISWEAAHAIMSRAVEREVETVGMDEKSFLRGQSYASVLYNLKAGSERVLDVMEGRDASAADSLGED
jgi:hypothetical protein